MTKQVGIQISGNSARVHILPIFVQGADRILNEAGAVLSLSGDAACPGGAHRLVGRQTQRAQWRKGYHVGAQHWVGRQELQAELGGGSREGAQQTEEKRGQH